MTGRILRIQRTARATVVSACVTTEQKAQFQEEGEYGAGYNPLEKLETALAKFWGSISETDASWNDS